MALRGKSQARADQGVMRHRLTRSVYDSEDDIKTAAALYRAAASKRKVAMFHLQ